MLSSTSNSPLHEGKKTKTFISPNRFAILVSDVTSDDPVFDTAPSFRDDTVVSSPHTMDHRTEPPAPPLYIRNIINFSAFKNVLIKTVGLDGFTCKSTPSYLIVRPNGRDNFNALANYLMDTNASFHTFRPPVDRPFRIVIRNLHHSTLSADISTALLEEGHIYGKLVSDVEYIKEVFLVTSNTLFQDFANKNEIIKHIQGLPISRIINTILCINGEISNQLQTDLAAADFFSVCLYESIDVTSQARLEVFVRFISVNIIKEELIKLITISTQATCDIMFDIMIC
ncbi:hypothetical protein QTP88_012632 [Uroleucon formosanum]